MNNMATGISPEKNSPPDWHAVDAVAFFYITLPLYPFLFAWFRFPLNIIAITAISYGVIKVARLPTKAKPHFHPGHYTLVATIAFALVWSSFGGAGHLFYANPFDWIPRFALARDLTASAWPLAYDDHGTEQLLRAPLGYYLVPVVLAKYLGTAWLDGLIYLWTALGTSLLFLLAFRDYPLRKAMAGMLIFIFASGLDVIGSWWQANKWPELGHHIEWWAGQVQYSSNTTLLFWAPNHTLAAWLATALLLRFNTSITIMANTAPLLLPALLIWSPLSAIGYFILLASALINYRHFKSSWPPFIHCLLPQIIPIGLIVIFLSSGASQIPATASPSASSDHGTLDQALLFLTLELGIIAPIFMFRRNHLEVISFIALLVIPSISFGGSNDLAMRASIPLFAVLWLGIINVLLQDEYSRSKRPTIALVLLLWAIGSYTAISELARSLQRPSWTPSLTLTLPKAFTAIGSPQAFPPHYFFVSSPDSLISVLLAKPYVINSSTEPFPP